MTASTTPLDIARSLTTLYLVIVSGTVLALVVLSLAAPPQAPAEAWIHAMIVLVLGVLLPLRLRRARQGRRTALRASGLIAAVLLLANVIEALVPGLFPAWMRLEMVMIAILMAGILVCVARAAARADRAGEAA
ncbi:hypothetical protein [Brachybacterium sacelli]|uniref:Peptidoglycan/LPS O-acetylase OafA/YrhL n=1 Tax=Brachybacterium sacelli TaxID=173364 RepID=A0ABS4X054_9MICO|nr:hypothetical protein [Brachybacterium sacelli]MBP2381839.1 peptidoglycan/LPS O-acetylase OafA/YrhL [Brachybacterium sacelli]